MTPAEEHSRRIERSLFLIPFLTYSYFYQGSDQSIAARFDLIRSMLERHALWIDDYCGFNTADIISVGGHYYSVKAPGTSLTALVSWSLITIILRPLASRNEPLYWALATYLTTIATTSLLIAIAAVLMYRFARHLGVSEGRSAGISLVFALATLGFPYATELTGEPIAAATSFAAFYLIATFDKEPTSERAFWGGFLAGLAVLNDYPALLIAAPIGIYAMWRLKSRELLSFSAGVAMMVLVMVFYNWGAFGNPLFFSYEAFKLTPGNLQFPEQARGFVGLTYPKIEILWNILLDPQRGLFFCNPVLMLAIPGAAYFARRTKYRAEMAVAVFAFTAMILFNASYGESIISWGGGTATGPRQIVAAIPFMVLTLAFLPASCNYLIGALGAISAAIMLMAAATNPHFPYEYDNPVRDFAMQQYARGDFATNRDAFFGGGMLVRDSVAFNLGKLARLPGPVQLWPLGAIWMLGAVELGDALGAWPEGAARGATVMAIAGGIAAVFLLPLSGVVASPLELAGGHGLLGRYYVGEQPETPPHIVRIDPQLDMNDIVAMGAMPFPSVDIWTGRIIVPRAGKYQFSIDVDDSGWLKIDGHTVIRDPGSVNKGHDEGAIELRPGMHRIEVGERNIGGGSYIHLYWKPPGAPDPQVVPSEALLPDLYRP